MLSPWLSSPSVDTAGSNPDQTTETCAIKNKGKNKVYFGATSITVNKFGERWVLPVATINLVLIAAPQTCSPRGCPPLPVPWGIRGATAPWEHLWTGQRSTMVSVFWESSDPLRVFNLLLLQGDNLWSPLKDTGPGRGP